MNAVIVISTSSSAATDQPDWLARLGISALRRVLPAANPDFEHLYERVRTWHVEIDSQSGEPLREVGLDSAEHVVVIGPWRDNHGFIVDCNGTFDPAEYPHVSPDQFEREWNTFQTSNVV